MGWALIDDNFPHHPKVVQAVTQHAQARDLFVCGLCYCRKYRTGGFIPDAGVRTLGVSGNLRRITAALLLVGLWDVVPGGYQIHDYEALYDDAGEKATRDLRSQQKREAGRKGGLARAAAQADSPQANFKHAAKQTDSTVQADERSTLQAHRTGEVRIGEVLDPGSSEEQGEPRFDEWLLDLQESYPRQRVTSGWLTQTAFVDALNKCPGGPHIAWEAMQKNLENQKRGYEWRVKKLIPKLQTWLKDGLWLQQHDENPPEALANEKTSRTLSSAAEFIRGGK